MQLPSGVSRSDLLGAKICLQLTFSSDSYSAIEFDGLIRGKLVLGSDSKRTQSALRLSWASLVYAAACMTWRIASGKEGDSPTVSIKSSLLHSKAHSFVFSSDRLRSYSQSIVSSPASDPP